MSGVEITLADRTETLRPSLKAARAVNAIGGGFGLTAQRVSGLDLETYIAVVAAGLDRKPKDVEEAVFAAGMSNLTGPLAEFIMLLANGGRPVDGAQ